MTPAQVLRATCALGILLGAAACPRSSTRNGATATSASATRAPERFRIADAIFDGGLQNQWEDFGWAPRKLVGGSARINFASYGGWILAKKGLKGSFGGLTFRVKAPPGEAEFLEVRVDAPDEGTFPRIKVAADHRLDVGDGWTEVLIPMTLLNPDDRAFDRIVLRAFREVPADEVLVDKIALTQPDVNSLALLGDGGARAYDPASAKPIVMRVDCRARATKINPWIYGIASHGGDESKDAHQFQLGATMRRWGGNPTTRYNWEIHAWNTASDWFYENVPVGPYTTFLSGSAAHSMKSALTVPLIGWVAKDTSSMSFPVSQFGEQQQNDSYRPAAGNGKTKEGKLVKPGAPTLSSVAAPPDFVRRWVAAIRKADDSSGARSVDMYILDNEPGLWHETHRDVHPDPLTYDELLERTIQYGEAVRAADTGALIAGPAAWGWPEYFFSAKDAAVGFSVKPDRRLHGDVPLLAWYLRKLREHEQKTGTRILDVLDVHFYPQAKDVFTEKKDRATAALRLRSTRGLWDPTYADESWIKEPIRLIPRMKEWIAENYPGRGLSIGEYNFGGALHMSGALAQAEALGRFGQGGVTAAFYWTYPAAGSPALHAFRAYRDFDGKGGRFLDWSLPTTSAPEASLFASRDEAGAHVVLVALNLSPDLAERAQLDLTSCGVIESQRAYAYSGGAAGFAAATAGSVADGSLVQILPPYSLTVVDVRLRGAMPGSAEK